MHLIRSILENLSCGITWNVTIHHGRPAPASRRFACEDEGSRRRVAEQWSRLIVCKLPKRHGEDPRRDSARPRMTPSLARINPFQILVIENRPRAPDKSSAICMKRRDLGDGGVAGFDSSMNRTNLLSCSVTREFREQFSLRIGIGSDFLN